MKADRSQAAALATNRFGLGARPGEIAAAAADPMAYLRAQLDAPSMPSMSIMGPAAELARLPGSVEALDAHARALRERRENGATGAIREVVRPLYVAQVTARYRAAAATPQSFRERLVHFWTNHFAVSIDKPQVLALAGTLENEAIRPHLDGSFRELLLAVESHPAMILYLDNQASVGPNSALARRARRKLDINENLAREILELHTLGVEGGYEQRDVTTFAHVLTGWSVGRQEEAARGFVFRAAAHEPGAAMLLGKRYAEDGQAQGQAVLRDLARHPATAIHVATKLARHFIADDAPPAAVARLARVFRDTDGSLPELHRTLLDLPGAWEPELRKYKTPSEYALSTWRALGTPLESRPLLNALELLGQRCYAPGSPEGWPDTAAQWDGPDALRRRIEWAAQVAAGAAAATQPPEIAEQSLGSTLSDRTRIAIARAASREQGLTLLLASPDFLRR